ncbi:MAG: flagellar FlbD family protein [Spirochaetes bacterium]|nr:flagellar FlbD family protein [Spirochaetota bacterium]
MIKLTKLNGEDFYVNPHQIEFIEKVPETILRMLSGKTIYVRESVEEVIEKIIDYRKKITYFKDVL